MSIFDVRIASDYHRPPPGRGAHSKATEGDGEWTHSMHKPVIVRQKLLPDCIFRTTGCCPESRNESAQQKQSSQQYQGTQTLLYVNMKVLHIIPA